MPLTSMGRGLSKGELLFNRFFFDRDIRDRDVWLHRDLANDVDKGGEGQSK